MPRSTEERLPRRREMSKTPPKGNERSESGPFGPVRATLNLTPPQIPLSGIPRRENLPALQKKALPCLSEGGLGGSRKLPTRNDYGLIASVPFVDFFSAGASTFGASTLGSESTFATTGFGFVVFLAEVDDLDELLLATRFAPAYVRL